MAVTPALVRVLTQWPLVPGFTSEAKLELSPSPRISSLWLIDKLGILLSQRVKLVANFGSLDLRFHITYFYGFCSFPCDSLENGVLNSIAADLARST